MAHVSWYSVNAHLTFQQRSHLIVNQIMPPSPSDKWARCALCVTKKLTDYKQNIPHMDSILHTVRLANAKAPVVSPTPQQQQLPSERVSLTSACVQAMQILEVSLEPDEVEAMNLSELMMVRQNWDQMNKVMTTVQGQLASLEAKLKGTKEAENPYICHICTSRPRSRMFLPCKHLVTCQKCELSLNPKICPMCRAPIHESMEVVLC